MAAGDPLNLILEGGEQLPKQFGKYTLLRKLAAGGMAEIFLSLHRSVAGFEKLVVIKRILPSMNTDRGFIDMLLHEARIAATLSHPNIVQIFDVGQVDGTYFIAMEHIHGEDIRSIVRAMKKKSVTEFPLEHTLSIVLGMCAGLAYAHEKRDLDGRLLDIVHRDISPQNIVVTFTGDVKIVDFGIAKSGAQTGEDTKDGQLKGKVPYMSPEQASGESIDWRSDIFAAGVMLFELTTGKRLFKGQSEFETLKLICEKEYPLPSQVRPGYPAALEQVVVRALAKKREDRYQSAREMQQDLEAFVREERLPVSQVSVTKWMQNLFLEKLAQQKEALQDIKQLADVIAAQQAPLSYEGTNTGTGIQTNTQMTSLGAASSIAPVQKRGSMSYVIAGLLVAAIGVGGFFVYKQQTAASAAQVTAPAAAPAPAPPPPAPEPKGSLDITTKPDGCAIWIDGDLRPEATPAKIEKLPIGHEFEVKITKEGLEPYREKVTLSTAAPLKKIETELKSGSVTLVLKVDPPPTIFLDGKPWKGGRDKIDGISAGEEHKLVIAANGYAPKTIQFTAGQGETKIITEHLARMDPAQAAAALAAAREEHDKKAASAKGAEEKGAAASGPAKVRVGAKGGFCTVTINGTSYGPTPVEAQVSSGTVRVSCKPASGASMSQAVNVAPGETARVSFKVDN